MTYRTAAFVVGLLAQAVPVAAGDEALSCIREAVKIEAVEYRVVGLGFPKVSVTVINGLSWPVAGLSVDYEIRRQDNGALEYDGATWVNDLDLITPIVPGETREIEMIGVYLEDRPPETLVTTAVLRDVMDVDRRQVVKDGGITPESYGLPATERPCP